jgi:hypothetical protein
LSSRADISLDGSFERVMFANTVLSTDYDRSSVYARYRLQGARTDLTANLGATTINEPGSSTTGGLATLALSRKLSAAAQLTFTAGRELTDAGTSFSSLQPGAIGIVTSGAAAQTSQNYTSTYVSAGWQYARYRTKLAVSARWEKDTYPGQSTFDLNRPGAEFSLERRLTRTFTARLLGRWYKTDYPHATLASEVASSNEAGLMSTTVGPESDVVASLASSNYYDALVGASLAWRHGHGLEVRLRYEHTSHVVSAGSSGYQENRVVLTVGYRPGTLATELPEAD